MLSSPVPAPGNVNLVGPLNSLLLDFMSSPSDKSLLAYLSTLERASGIAVSPLVGSDICEKLRTLSPEHSQALVTPLLQMISNRPVRIVQQGREQNDGEAVLFVSFLQSLSATVMENLRAGNAFSELSGPEAI